MPPVLTVVKVGGSLVTQGARLRAVLCALADGRDGPAVVVPGGGPFAEAVRTAQGALRISDGLAHRLALDAMGRMAEVFSELEPRLRIMRDVDTIRAALAERYPAPLKGCPSSRRAPSPLLEWGPVPGPNVVRDAVYAVLWNPVALRSGHPDIPESWDVTSDSLALWLAARLGAGRCILLKSAPCPAGARPEALTRLGLVDKAFPDFANRFAGEIVLSGPDGEAAVVGRGDEWRFSSLPPHPEVLRSGLEGGLQKPRQSLEASFETRLRLAPQDEGEPGIGREERQCRTVDGAA